MSTTPRHLYRPRRQAFTLIEVLIAAGIFAVGLIAVAAIFPTAIQLQKQTFEEIRGDEFSKTVKSIVLDRGFDERALAIDAPNPSGTPSRDPLEVFASARAVDPLEPSNTTPLVPPSGSAPGSNEIHGWSLSDRSSGSLEQVFYSDNAGNNASPSAATTFSYGGRTLFWTPLFIDRNRTAAVAPTGGGAIDDRTNRAWSVFVFVTRRDSKSYYTRSDGLGGVKDFAIDEDIDLPDLEYVAEPAPDPATELPVTFVPGIARIEVTVDGTNKNQFNFTSVDGNRVRPSIADSSDNPIVRVGDEILAQDGSSYVVDEIDADRQWIRVRGFIVNSTANPILEIWAAHPGSSGESSFVKLLHLADDPDVNNLIRSR